MWPGVQKQGIWWKLSMEIFRTAVQHLNPGQVAQILGSMLTTTSWIGICLKLDPFPKASQCSHNSSKFISLNIEIASITMSVSTVLTDNFYIIFLFTASDAWINIHVSASSWEQGTMLSRSASASVHSTLGQYVSRITEFVW